MYYFAFGISPFEFALKEGGSVKLAVMSGNYKLMEAPGYTEEYFNVMKSALTVDLAARPTALQLLNEIEFIYDPPVSANSRSN